MTSFAQCPPLPVPWPKPARTALLTVHVTVSRSLSRGLQTTVASALGVALSFVVGAALGVSLWTAMILPTFLGNHDQGRFARDVRRLNPNASEAEVLARVKLGHAMLLTLRGVPTIIVDGVTFAGDVSEADALAAFIAEQVPRA